MVPFALPGPPPTRRIRLFIGVHRERLNATFGARFRRAPAVNTLRALVHALDPAEIEAAFRRHAEHLGDATAPPGRRVIALDGKTLRGSFDHLDDQAAAQVLSAFASDAALILAHQEIAAGEEIAAAQALIEQLGLRGVLFTADALHCQKNLRHRRGDRQRAVGAGERQPAAPCAATPAPACGDSGMRWPTMRARSRSTLKRAPRRSAGTGASRTATIM